MENKKKIIVKNYRGNQSTATSRFNRDATIMAEQGYVPTTQNYAPGSYGCGSFIIALLLCFIVIGIIAFIYMLVVKPDGRLSVTYELKESNISSQINEKECPMCAEKIKLAAKVCRYCGHKFEEV